MFREQVDVGFNTPQNEPDYQFTPIPSPFGTVQTIQATLTWVSDGPNDPNYQVTIAVDPKAPYIHHAVSYPGDPDHKQAIEWAAHNNIFYYCTNTHELTQLTQTPHITGWRITHV